MTVRALAMLFALVVGPVCGQDESFASSLLSGLLDTLDTQVDAKNCPGVCMHALASLICTKVLDEVECPKSSMKCCVDEPLGNDTMITTRRPFTTRYTTTEADDEEDEEGPTTLAPHDAYKDSGNIACPGVCVETSLTQYCISYLTSKNLCAEGRLCCVSKEGYGDKPPADLVVPNEKKHSTKKPTTALTTVPPRPRPGRKCQGDCISGLFALLCDQVDEDAACPADGTCCVTDYRPETTTRRPTTPRPTTLPPLRRCPGRCMLTIMVAFCEQPATLMPNTECKASGRICCDDTNVPKRTKRPPTTTTTSTTPAPADARPDCPGSCIVPYLSFTCFRNAEMTDVFKCKKSGTQCCAPKSRVQEALGSRDRNDTYPLTTSAPYVHAPPPTTPMAIYEPSYGSTLKMPEKYNKYVCGVKGTSAAAGAGEVSGRRGRVMGGEDGERGEWCWQVALINSLNQYLCGAALIGTQWVLTAAHCVTNIVRSGEPIFVRVGDHDLTRKYGSPGAQTLRVATTYIHHNHNSQTLDNDIALLKLLGKAELKEGMKSERNGNVFPAPAAERTPPNGSLRLRKIDEMIEKATEGSLRTWTPPRILASLFDNVNTPGQTPLCTPVQRLLSTPRMTPGMTPLSAPGMTPCWSPGMMPFWTPGMMPLSTPFSTPFSTPRKTPRRRHSKSRRDLIIETESQRNAVPALAVEITPPEGARTTNGTVIDLTLNDASFSKFTPQRTPVSATSSSVTPGKRPLSTPRKAPLSTSDETPQKRTKLRCTPNWAIKVRRDLMPCVQDSAVVNLHDAIYSDSDDERTESDEEMRYERERCYERDLIVSEKKREATGQNTERQVRVELMRKAANRKRVLIMTEKEREEISQMTERARCKKNLIVCKKEREATGQSAGRQKKVNEVRRDAAHREKYLMVSTKERDTTGQNAMGRELVEKVIRKATALCKCSLVLSEKDQETMSESAERQESVEEMMKKAARCKRDLILSKKNQKTINESAERQERVKEDMKKAARYKRDLISSEKGQETMSVSAERLERVEEEMKKAARCKMDLILSEKDQETMNKSAGLEERERKVMGKAACPNKDLIVSTKKREETGKSAVRQKRVEKVIRKVVRSKGDLIVSEKERMKTSECAGRKESVEEAIDLVIEDEKLPPGVDVLVEETPTVELSPEIQERATLKDFLISSEEEGEETSESAGRQERVKEVITKTARLKRALISSEKEQEKTSENGGRQESVEEVIGQRALISSDNEREEHSESAGRLESVEEVINLVIEVGEPLPTVGVLKEEILTIELSPEIQDEASLKDFLIPSEKKQEETSESGGRQESVEEVIRKAERRALILSEKEREEHGESGGRQESVEEVIGKRALISNANERNEHCESVGRQERIEEVIRKTARPKRALISSEKEREETSESGGRQENVEELIKIRALISSENEREEHSQSAGQMESVEEVIYFVIEVGEPPPGVDVLVEEIPTVDLSPEIQDEASLKDFYISSVKEREERSESAERQGSVEEVIGKRALISNANEREEHSVSAGRKESVEKVIDMVIEVGEPSPGVGVPVEEILTIELTPEVQERASLKDFLISSEKEREETTEIAGRQASVEEVIGKPALISSENEREEHSESAGQMKSVEQVIDLVIEDGEPPPGVGVLVEEILAVDISPEIQEQASLKDFSWSEDFSTFSGKEETYLRTPGPSIPAHAPVEVFKYIWDERIMQVIVDETNRYARQFIAPLSEVEGRIPETLNDWYDTNIDEMYRYFAVVILMSLRYRSRVNDYWDTGPLSMSDFRKLMSQSRFHAISRFLHFVDNEYFDPLRSSNHKKFSKVRPVVQHCNTKFQQMYVPNKHLSLDESSWKGRLSRLRCPSTEEDFDRLGFQFKSYELCESQTGYLVRYLLPAGKDSSTLEEPVHGFKNAYAKLVLELTDGFLDAGHTLTMDNWYDQLTLTRFLKRRGTDVLGTINPRRHMHVPQDIRAANLSRGERLARHCGDITLVAWMDDKLVTTMSTYHDNSVVSGTREGVAHDQPAVIAAYNKYRGGVNLKDLQLSMFPMERIKGVKWYMKVFQRLLNTSLFNAYIVHCSTATSQPLTHREFRVRVAVDLLERHDSTPRELPIRLPVTPAPIDKRLQPGNHFMGLTEMKVLGSCLRYHVQKHCARCLAQGRRTLVKYMCTLCDVPLCASECWAEYHTLTELN